jgi:hypothetical protein
VRFLDKPRLTVSKELLAATPAPARRATPPPLIAGSARPPPGRR